MNTIRFCTFASLITILDCCQGPRQFQSQNGREIVRADVYSINFSIKGEVAIPPESLMQRTEVVHVVITDDEYLWALDKQLDSLESRTSGISVNDVRLVALLSRHNGVVDTLSFGFVTARLNARTFEMDTTMVFGIARYLPQSNYEIVRLVVNRYN